MQPGHAVWASSRHPFRPPGRPHRTSPWMPNRSAGRGPDVARVRRRCFAARRFRPTPPSPARCSARRARPSGSLALVSASWRRPPGSGLARRSGTRRGLEYFGMKQANMRQTKQQPAAAMQQKSSVRHFAIIPEHMQNTRLVRPDATPHDSRTAASPGQSRAAPCRACAGKGRRRRPRKRRRRTRRAQLRTDGR